MTAHPNDRDWGRLDALVDTDPIALRDAAWRLDTALAAAEHRATRAEAQSAIRGRAVAIYRERAREAEARIKAVQDIHTPEEYSIWDGDGAICQECLHSDGSSVEYPCPTIRALDA